MPAWIRYYRHRQIRRCRKRGKWGASKAGPQCRLTPNHQGECKPMRKKDWFA